MLDTMSKPRKPRSDKADKPKRGPVLFITLDHATDESLQAFIAHQRVAPDRAAVGLKALHEFLEREGYWPPKNQPKP